jgi:hypothetical protein
MEAKMKLFAAATLCLLIGAPTFAYQEQQQQQEEKQKPPQEPKADKKQEEPTKQEEKAKQNPGQEDKVKQTKQQQEAAKQQEKQQKQAEKQQKVQEKQERQQDEHSRVGQQRGAPETAAPAHGGRRIPDDKFHAEFGREHHFHIRIHSGETRFVYGGYSFEYIGAWPVGWGYGDEFYIELIGDDYYLCDVEHPEVQLIVIVVG